MHRSVNSQAPAYNLSHPKPLDFPQLCNFGITTTLHPSTWCLRRILNITWSEHVTNSEVRRRTGQPLLSDIVCARCLKLFGYVARADKSQDHSHALRTCKWHTPKNWKRRLGRPRHTWLRTVEADLRPFNLGLASGFKKAQDRTTWRALTGTRLRHRQAPNDDDDDDDDDDEIIPMSLGMTRPPTINPVSRRATST